MKSKIYILLHVMLFSGFIKTANAQAILHTTINSLSTSTPTIGDQLFVNIQLQNVSLTDTFKGVIAFDLANQDSIIENVAIVGKPNYNGTFITLAPLETKAGLFTVQIVGPNFVVGPDIIIVWPIASAIIFDSAQAPINIQGPLGIEEDESGSPQFLQTEDAIFIQLQGSKVALQGVRIFNLNGQLLIHQQLQEGNNSIPTENLPLGVYVAEIEMTNGKAKRVKWVK